MKIILKAGGHSSQFVGIDRSEFEGIIEYFKAREVEFVKVGEDDMKKRKMEEYDDDDDDESED